MAITPADATLDGRTALVTGAAAGIGEAVALALAAFGADVAVCDRDGEGLGRTVRRIEAEGRRAPSAVLDVRDATAVSAFAREVARAFPRVDVLVNNAGGGFEAPLLELSDGGLRALMNENFTSVVHFVRAVAPSMGEGGSIVNVTSIEAHRAAPGYAVYAAMKAAVENLTRSLALELGDRRIRVNCIAPDVIPTPGLPAFEAHTPLDRPGHVDDVAGAAVFLAGGLSGFVTGATLHVDGGNFAAGGWRRREGGGFSP